MASLYDVLEVPADADEAALRSAWRRLAMRYHPDRNPGDAVAAERFRALSEAWDVLGDPVRRKHYDEFGDDARSAFFDVDLARAAKQAEQQARRMRRRAPRAAERGGDHETTLTLTVAQAASGGVHEVMVKPSRPCPHCDGTGKRRNLRICSKCSGGVIPGIGPYRLIVPAGVVNGEVLVAPTLGAGGRGLGPPGDLRITVEVPVAFRGAGPDLSVDVPLRPSELAAGGTIRVPTPSGGAVNMKVPPGCRPGQKLRLKGKGRGGDLFAVLAVRPEDDRVVQAAKIRRR